MFDPFAPGLRAGCSLMVSVAMMGWLGSLLVMLLVKADALVSVH